ncbi:uncharacterized protein si:ch211-217g15.3 [Nothobranchius furzeri]|uniref:LOC107375618-like protein n=1 Tax=Nothobranchius furzeri TaxID=105023 RepID=A0A9D2YGT9_NOTFU|nr:putative LOC107375618-like protein [Nothobranchius furzeri]
MFRVFVSVLLLLGVTAKPWNKLTNEAFEDAVRSLHENGKLSWEVEVKPPEDTDGVQYAIHPGMQIWKNYPNVKEDLEKLHHPSSAELHAQILDPAAEVPISTKMKQEVVEDRVGIDPVFAEVVKEQPEVVWNEDNKKLGEKFAPLAAEDKVEVVGIPHQPETDKDELPSGSRRATRLYLQPEEDMDDLYHKDVPMEVLLQVDSKAAALVDLPFERKYSEPEEDLDPLYHQ